MGHHLYVLSTFEIKEATCPFCNTKIEGFKYVEDRAYKMCQNCHNEVVVVLKKDNSKKIRS